MMANVYYMYNIFEGSLISGPVRKCDEFEMASLALTCSLTMIATENVSL